MFAQIPVKVLVGSRVPCALHMSLRITRRIWYLSPHAKDMEEKASLFKFVRRATCP